MLDSFDLRDYVATFSSKQQEAVMNEILKSDLIKRALQNPTTKVLLEAVLDIVKRRTVQIYSLCATDYEGNKDAVKQAATELKNAHIILVDWAQKLEAGEKHREAIENLKQRR